MSSATMQRVQAVIHVLVLSFGAAHVAGADEWSDLTDADGFRAVLAGKKLTSTDQSETYVSHADGSVTGTVRGEPYTGTWVWREGTACYHGSVRGENPVYACAKISVKDVQARFAWVGWQTFLYDIGD